MSSPDDSPAPPTVALEPTPPQIGRYRILERLGAGGMGAVYRAGEKDWRRVELKAQTLQISDLREFAACVARKKQPDFSPEHDLTVQEALLRASGMLAGKR